MAIFLKLILAHILGDFIFQPVSWVKSKTLKKHKSPYLYWHLLIHTLALILVLQFEMKYLGGIIIIISSHFIIDLIKLNLKNRFNDRILFLIDQVAHLLIIIGVAYIYEPFSINTNAMYSTNTILLVNALLLVSVVSAIVMKVIMSQWEIQEDKESSLANAGMYIGMLERLLVFTFIILQQWEAIGFLIAAKSVFRFSDLSRAKDRKLTEYILIGTLISFSLAILVGLIYLRMSA